MARRLRRDPKKGRKRRCSRATLSGRTAGPIPHLYTGTGATRKPALSKSYSRMRSEIIGMKRAIMRFAKIVFLVAGIYGLLILAPIYFMEEKIERETPPAITHPEYFYGFLGVGLAWQVLFPMLSRDP